MGRKSKNTPEFKDFWEAYGLKRDREGAEKAWQRLSDKDRRAACAGIDAYRDACMARGVAMAYGQRYLTHRRWEDDHVPTGDKKRLPDQTADALDDMEIW